MPYRIAPFGWNNPKFDCEFLAKAAVEKNNSFRINRISPNKNISKGEKSSNDFAAPSAGATAIDS